MIVDTPPSGAEGELTEKGTINARALLRNRQELVEALFSQQPRNNVLTPMQMRRNAESVLFQSD
jgi:feruloyl-CoA synthase